MLSIAILKNSTTASNYYSETDNYYSSDHTPSQWQGNGAQRLGLSGKVDAIIFRELLDGRMPSGQIHNAADGRRAGIDLTFSAPKSVSLQALVGGDANMINAHEKAVARALDYAESLAAYRITETGQTRLELSGNLVVASFLHDLSRATDPNLHTHAVLINATQRPDGQWRALEVGSLLQQKMLMGALYRAELAQEIKQLGYDIRVTHADGRFELAHFTEKQIEAFSNRSQAIEAELSKSGKTRDSATTKEKQFATLATRATKGEVDHIALHQSWCAKSQELGIDFAKYREANVEIAQQQPASAAVTFAVAHNTERQAVVSEAQLLRSALEHGTGITNLQEIRIELARQVQSGELILADKCYTTQLAQERERQILDIEMRGRGNVTPILNASIVERALSVTLLNPGQRAAVSLVVTTDARVSAIQGAAGTGKTTMLVEAKTLAESQGYSLMGLAPSAAAARELARVGIESRTLASFNHRENLNLTTKTILIVDEAGMVSAKDMHTLLERAETANARVVLIGDTQQLKAIEAGKPFAQLQQAGIAKIEMSEIQRQSNMQLRHAVGLAAHGNTADSLAILNRHVIEIHDPHQRYQSIAKDYSMLSADERNKTLILAGTHIARVAINNNVRSELGLSGKGIITTTLERKDLTEVQMRMSISYRNGDIVEARKHYVSLGLARGDMATVIKSEAGSVTLERTDGVQINWRPASQNNMTVYQVSERELAVGDMVRLTANHHAQGIVNGERALVASVDALSQKIVLTKADGNILLLDATKPLHLDHGYCSTVHSAQGQTTSKALIEADTKSFTANESSFYVAISRAKEEVQIYTDDKGMLPISMGRENVKHAALDVKCPGKDSELER